MREWQMSAAAAEVDIEPMQAGRDSILEQKTTETDSFFCTRRRFSLANRAPNFGSLSFSSP